MILPTKRLGPDKALITVGAEVLKLLDESKTISRTWEDLKSVRGERSTLTYDWFVLALDLLFLIGAIEFQRGRLVRVGS